MSHDWACGLRKLIQLEYVLFFELLSHASLVLFFPHFDQIQLEYVDDLEQFHCRVKQGDLCVTKIDDIERNGYCFTDGNGLISKGLARLVAQRLDYVVKFKDDVWLTFF